LAQLRSAVSAEQSDVIRHAGAWTQGFRRTASAVALAERASNLESLADSVQAGAALNLLVNTFELTTAEWARNGWTAQNTPAARGNP
jgi:hypothetical protein